MPASATCETGSGLKSADDNATPKTRTRLCETLATASSNVAVETVSSPSVRMIMLASRSPAEGASNSSTPLITASLNAVSPAAWIPAIRSERSSVFDVKPVLTITSLAKVTMAIWSPGRDWLTNEVAAAFAWLIAFPAIEPDVSMASTTPTGTGASARNWTSRSETGSPLAVISKSAGSGVAGRLRNSTTMVMKPPSG